MLDACAAARLAIALLPRGTLMTAEFQVIDLKIPEDLAGQRLDVALARLLPDHSRTRIRSWIDAGQVLVGRLPCKPKDVEEAGSQVNVRMTGDEPRPGVLPGNIPLTLVYLAR